MDFYEEAQGVASELLAEFRQGVCTLTRRTHAPGTEPWEPGASTEAIYDLDATVKAVSTRFVDGTTVLATDREVTCAALAIEPAPADILSIDGKVVTVVRTMRIPAAGTVVAWRFIARG